MHLASGELPGTFLRDYPGLARRGLGRRRLPARRPAAWSRCRRRRPTGRSLALTAEGIAFRRRSRTCTDRLAVFPYEALGEEACAELRTLTRPFSRAVVDAAGLGR